MHTRFFASSLAVLAFCSSFSSVIAQEEEAILEAVVESELPRLAPPTPEGATETSDAAKPKLRPLTVSIGLIEDTRLNGTLIDSTSIAIKTAFGEASIPLSEVAGTRLPAVEDTSTTVVMLNGDSITGATDLKFISIETTWGSAKINGQNIATMQFVPGLTWKSSESLGGKRWTLTEATPQTGPAVQQASATGSSQPMARPQNTGQIVPRQVIPSNPQIIYGR